MTSRVGLRLLAPLALAVGGAIVFAQTSTPLPQNPPRDYGASVNPSFEGWFDNPDGTHGFSLGYYSRNKQVAIDIPIGPDNHFEPGEPDRGQPTHFLSGRHYGMFVVTVPKEFGKTQKLTWTLTANGQTFSIPSYLMHAEYNVSPLKSSQQGASGYNTPPVLRFDPKGTTVVGPAFGLATAPARTATVNEPMPLDLWVEDDALYQNDTSVPLSPSSSRLPVTVLLSKYRGPGEVTFVDARPKMETLKGGRPDEPYSGKTSTTVKFSEPGDYMLHVLVNDYSGSGTSNCCWTNAIVRVKVVGTSSARVGSP